MGVIAVWCGVALQIDTCMQCSASHFRFFEKGIPYSGLFQEHKRIFMQVLHPVVLFRSRSYIP